MTAHQILPENPPAAPIVLPAPTLRCFNVKFSPNLGDGLLSECLERALVDLGAAAETRSVDLAARTAYGDVLPGRDAIMKTLETLPGPLRRLAVRAPLALAGRRKWRPHFRTGLEGADGVVIGGGNLISDLDLNFPTKLTLAIEESEARGLPIAIYACGMAGGWSATGLRWCRKAFASRNLRAVFVRDAESKALWDDLMAPQTGHTAEVVRDPGLLAADLYPAPPRALGPRPGERPVAGLGIMSQIAIRYHHAASAPSPAALDAWYLGLARSLLADGFSLRIFTNGSPEDRAYAARLEPRLRALGDHVAMLDQRDPAGLCAHVAGLDVLVAFRMHAVIAAYAYGVPAVALAWDRKLASFMASVGRSPFLIDVAETAPEAAATLAARAAREGLPEAERQAVLAEARADVAKLWAVFRPKEAR